jgi:hypothetical protein
MGAVERGRQLSGILAPGILLTRSRPAIRQSASETPSLADGRNISTELITVLGSPVGV